MAKNEDLNKLKSISKSNNLRFQALYYYDLSKEPKSKKVRFVYLLKGRKKGEGVIQRFKGSFLVNGCFTIPIKHDQEMQEILNKWKIKYKRKLMLTY